MYTDWIFTGYTYKTLKECKAQQGNWIGPVFGEGTIVGDAQCYPSDFDPRGKDRWTRLKR